jgi:hypothetical protein
MGMKGFIRATLFLSLTCLFLPLAGLADALAPRERLCLDFGWTF